MNTELIVAFTLLHDLIFNLQYVYIRKGKYADQDEYQWVATFRARKSMLGDTEYTTRSVFANEAITKAMRLYEKETGIV